LAEFLEHSKTATRSQQGCKWCQGWLVEAPNPNPDGMVLTSTAYTLSSLHFTFVPFW
jgi:hypothetical protein